MSGLPGKFQQKASKTERWPITETRECRRNKI